MGGRPTGGMGDRRPNEKEVASMTELQTLMSGIVFGEQPRWHEDRLWFSDWGPPEVIAVDLEGHSEVILEAPAFPCCVDWLPDGRLLLVSAREGLLLRREPDGSARQVADGIAFPNGMLVTPDNSTEMAPDPTCRS
jgi:sugar lactone lactonase YvrE